MELKDIITEDLPTIEEALGNQVFTWKGEEYICIPSGRGHALTLHEGGFGEEADLILKVRIELFSDIFPQPQQTLSYDDETFRILNVRKDSTKAFFVLTLVSTTRGA